MLFRSRQACTENELNKKFKESIQYHKDRMKQYDGIAVPERIMGEEEPPIGCEEKDILSGIPASAGCVKGSICVIQSFEDFKKMKTGEILVIPYSDVGWTPLFAKASAVIAESGGMLSHSAIVAREYGIPAIVSVANAMNIKDGQQVMVDANNGYIYLQK